MFVYCSKYNKYIYICMIKWLIIYCTCIQQASRIQFFCFNRINFRVKNSSSRLLSRLPACMGNAHSRHLHLACAIIEMARLAAGRLRGRFLQWQNACRQTSFAFNGPQDIWRRDAAIRYQKDGGRRGTKRLSTEICIFNTVILYRYFINKLQCFPVIAV